MKFLLLKLWTGGLSTDDNNEINNDNDETQRTIHDFIGSLALTPNEPIKSHTENSPFMNFLLDEIIIII